MKRAAQFAEEEPARKRHAEGEIDNNESVSTEQPEEDDTDYDLFVREEAGNINPQYMDVQTSITHPMRRILIEWMIEVLEDYMFCTETEFLAVRYLDRFLSVVQVDKSKLQLVGMACMLIASKMEEIRGSVSIAELVYISADSYTKKEVIDMERWVLSTLKFRLSLPTPCDFVKRLSSILSFSVEAASLLQFLMTLCLMFAFSLNFRDSTMSAAAAFLTLHVLGLPTQRDNILKAAFTSKETELDSCIKELHLAHQKVLESTGKKFASVRTKFTKEKWCNVIKLSSRALCN